MGVILTEPCTGQDVEPCNGQDVEPVGFRAHAYLFKIHFDINNVVKQ